VGEVQFIYWLGGFLMFFVVIATLNIRADFDNVHVIINMDLSGF